MNQSEPEIAAPPPVVRERNQTTRRIHQQQLLWQVTIPMIVIFIIMLTFAVLAAMSGPATTSQMADASIIILSGPILIFGLISLVLTVALIYGLLRLINVLPYSFYQVHQFLLLLGGHVNQVNNSLVRPFIRAKGFTASTRAFRRSLRQVMRSR